MAHERLKSPRVRLFVALELPDEFRERLARWREDAYRELPGLRLPARETLHVTLVFLGYQAERDIERITEICFAEAPGRFALEVVGMKGVPPRRSRLHALDLSDRDGGLARWQAALSERLARAGLYEPEKRPFWPHVTLARVKRGVRAAAAPPALPAELT